MIDGNERWCATSCDPSNLAPDLVYVHPITACEVLPVKGREVSILVSLNDRSVVAATVKSLHQVLS